MLSEFVLSGFHCMLHTMRYSFEYYGMANPVMALSLSLQDENTPFCPNCIKSNFLHVFVVVQVEHPNSPDTVYKVKLEAFCA